MRTFKIEKPNKEITSHAGMALIGAAVNKHTSLTKSIDAALPKRHGTPASGMVKTTIGLFAQGKIDFQAISNVRGDNLFAQAFDLDRTVPTDISIRTRHEKEANTIIPDDISHQPPNQPPNQPRKSIYINTMKTTW